MKKLLILVIVFIIFILVVVCCFRLVSSKLNQSSQLAKIINIEVILEPMYGTIPTIEIEEKEEIRYKSLGIFKITAYCSCNICSEEWGNITASGKQAQSNHTIAAPPNIPFGTKLLINGNEYVVEDRGGAIKGNRLDMYFDSHKEALNWGVKNLEVLQIIE